MPSRFTQYGGAAGADQVLQQIIAEKIAAEQLALKNQMEMHKLHQGDRGLDLEGGRLRLGQDELGERTKEYGEAAPTREAGRLYAQAQTAELQRKPIAEADARAQAGLLAEREHNDRLGEIRAQGDQQARVAGIRTSDQKLVQIMGPNGVPIWVPESEAAHKPVANAPRQPTGADRNTLNFFRRMVEAERNARAVEGKLAPRDIGAMSYAPDMIENWLKTSEGKQYTQAQRMFTEARLRKESGAAIANTEYQNDQRTNFRVAGDDEKVLGNKRRARLETMRGIGNASGRAFQEFYGDNTTLDDLLKEFDTPQVAGAAPQVGQTKTFPNGRKGVWDGKGWVAQ